MDRVILPISGWMGSGKDTFGKFLKELAPQDVEILQFSTALKEMAAFLLDVPVEKFADREFKEKHRLFLQRLGTDVFRKQVDMNWWVKQLIHKISYTEKKIIVITDVRFPNEIQWLQEVFGENVRPIRIVRHTGKAEKHHISETALDDWTDWWLTIYNSNSLADLQATAEGIMGFLKK